MECPQWLRDSHGVIGVKIHFDEAFDCLGFDVCLVCRIYVRPRLLRVRCLFFCFRFRLTDGQMDRQADKQTPRKVVDCLVRLVMARADSPSPTDPQLPGPCFVETPFSRSYSYSHFKIKIRYECAGARINSSSPPSSLFYFILFYFTLPYFFSRFPSRFNEGRFA